MVREAGTLDLPLQMQRANEGTVRGVEKGLG